MALFTQDFSIDKGSSFILQFDLKRDDDTALDTLVGGTGSPPSSYALNTYSFRMKTIISKYGTKTPILDIDNVSIIQATEDASTGNTADGFYLYGSPMGRVKFVISSDTTSTLKYGTYHYDIEVVNTKTGGTEITKALAGKFNILAEVTT
jgi:hypothetical protein